MPPSLTFLELVNICDNVPIGAPRSSRPESPFDSERLIPWFLTPSPGSPVIGLLRPAIVDQLMIDNERCTVHELLKTWDLQHAGDQLNPRVSFSSWINTPAKRTAAMKELCERWRDAHLFEDVCGPKKWRNEMYSVYGDPFGPHDSPLDGTDSNQNYAFEMERSACALFGVVTYGVHLTIYQDDSDGDVQIWVPTRARTKQTWPGYLDNSVAGGIPSGMGIFESVVKESMEEASIEPAVVRGHAKAVGAVSYFFRTSSGWLQPEVEYVYDLRIPEGENTALFQPKPLDGEVESFELLSQDQVIHKMLAGLFKPNCALVLIDFFIRHGHITPDNEPNFMNIVTRLHGRFGYDRWSCVN